MAFGILLQITSALQDVLADSYSSISSLMQQYGYFGIFFLMLLEGASLPIPSEVVIPLAGYLAAKGFLNLWFAIAAVLLGSFFGTLIDYYIGYYIGREVVYKHLSNFKIKRATLDDFDAWFLRNGNLAVFAARLIPEVRVLINFPAGFAKMPMKSFLFFSMIGIFIWDFILLLFGYYLISTSNAVIVLASIGVFILLLYFIYVTFMKHIEKNRGHRKG